MTVGLQDKISGKLNLRLYRLSNIRSSNENLKPLKTVSSENVKECNSIIYRFSSLIDFVSSENLIVPARHTHPWCQPKGQEVMLRKRFEPTNL